MSKPRKPAPRMSEQEKRACIIEYVSKHEGANRLQICRHLGKAKSPHMLALLKEMVLDFSLVSVPMWDYDRRKAQYVYGVILPMERAEIMASCEDKEIAARPIAIELYMRVHGFPFGAFEYQQTETVCASCANDYYVVFGGGSTYWTECITCGHIANRQSNTGLDS
jgi:hypothetical protein